VAGIAGCGGGPRRDVSPATMTTSLITSTTASAAKLPRAVVAAVGRHIITTKLLNEWMQEQAGEDFYLASRHKMPAGLVGEPASPGMCVAAIKRFAPFSGQSDAQLNKRCEEIARGVKRQTLAYLITSYWSQDFAEAHGIAVGPGELQHEFARYKATAFGGEANFMRVMASRTRTIAQERFVVKGDMTGQKFLAKLVDRSANLQREALLHAAVAACPPEYLVEHCKGYGNAKATPANETPVSILMEEIASWRRRHA
jgi:hypothetical protein